MSDSRYEQDQYEMDKARECLSRQNGEAMNGVCDEPGCRHAAPLGCRLTTATELKVRKDALAAQLEASCEETRANFSALHDLSERYNALVAREAERTAECLSVACWAVCVSCKDNLPLTSRPLNGTYHHHSPANHQHPPAWPICFASPIRAAFADRWGKE